MQLYHAAYNFIFNVVLQFNIDKVR